jgi:hypothetical protein
VGPDSGETHSARGGSLIDLSFLHLSDTDGTTSRHAISHRHMSVVICGWSNTQWTGYVFTSGDDEDAEEEVDELRGPFLTTEYGFDFSTTQDRAQTWDARRYWLRLVAHRCQHVLSEWRYLVLTIEEGVESWVCQPLRVL